MERPTSTVASATHASTAVFHSTFRALDREFAVVADDPRVAPVVQPLLEPFRIEAPSYATETYTVAGLSDGSRFTVALDDDLILNTERVEDAAEHVVWHALKLAAEETDRYLVLHGAAVELDGSGVVLAAPPDQGKTTLAAALVGSGFRFLADEYALIDPRSGLLHPYPRPFMLPAPSASAVERAVPLPRGSIQRGHPSEHFVAPADIRRGPLGEPCPVRFIVRPAYRPDARTALQPRARANVTLELARESFNFDRLGPSALPLLAGVVEVAGTFDLPMSDLSTAMDLVRRLVTKGSM